MRLYSKQYEKHWMILEWTNRSHQSAYFGRTVHLFSLIGSHRSHKQYRNMERPHDYYSYKFCFNVYPINTLSQSLTEKWWYSYWKDRSIWYEISVWIIPEQEFCKFLNRNIDCPAFAVKVSIFQQDFNR